VFIASILGHNRKFRVCSRLLKEENKALWLSRFTGNFNGWQILAVTLF